MNKQNPSFTRREQAILLGLVLLACLIYSATKMLQAKSIPPVPAQSSACQTNLFLIDHAITRWATSNGYSTTNKPTVQEISSYLREGTLPSCPNRGTYQLGTLALASTCAIHGQAANIAVYPKENPVSEFIRSVLGRRSISAPRNTCIAYLKQLDGAAQQWALDNKMNDGNLVKPYEAVSYLKGGQFYICPLGGKYSYTQVSNPPCCTITGHSLP